MPTKTATRATKAATKASNLFDTTRNKPRFTGKRIVTMNREAKPSSIDTLSKKASLKIATIRDFGSDVSRYHEAFTQADDIYFDTFKIAIINKGREDKVKFMTDASMGTSNQVTSEPERYVYAATYQTVKK
jgi:hypothetical protein